MGGGGVVNTQCISTGLQSEIRNPKSEINLSPNPAFSTSTLTFTYSPSSFPRQIIINDINGREVAKYALPQWSTVQQVKLPVLSNGVYVVRLVGDGGLGNVKFVVE